jgi:hypothetical protein
MQVNSFPSDSILKRMGYFDDQEGIVRRYIEEGSNWDEHLKKSKAYIEKFIAESKPDKVAILGSGWLLDVPIGFLSEHCSKVYLFDIRHPRQIMHRHRNLLNVSYISQDISGGVIESVYSILSDKRPDFDKLNEISPPCFSTSESIDCVISVNILNQLDILLLEYIRKFPASSGFTFTELRRSIQESHIQSLQNYNSCLISDYEELVFDAENELLQTNSLLFTTVPPGKNREDWIWKFDTKMTYYPNRKTYFNVMAIQF